MRQRSERSNGVLADRDTVSVRQRRRREASFREAFDARAVLAKCAAALIVMLGIAAIGIGTSTEQRANTASVSAPRAANDR